MMHFEGVCDVCGERISLDHSWSQGIIDYGVAENGLMYTWIRHYATAPAGANPDCAVYSSLVWRQHPFTTATLPVHDQPPRCRFCGDDAHEPTYVAGIPIIGCPKIKPGAVFVA